MKKLISIGIALALLTMAVVPGAVAAYDLPATYSKVPFAIVASGFDLLAALWPNIDTALDMGFPWLTDVFTELADWSNGPLSWTVDMLAWGIGLGADLMVALSAVVELPFDVGALLDTIACSLITCFAVSECSGNFSPCG